MEIYWPVCELKKKQVSSLVCGWESFFLYCFGSRSNCCLISNSTKNAKGRPKIPLIKPNAIINLPPMDVEQT